MNCLKCRGACCEVMDLPIASTQTPDRYWLTLHAEVKGKIYRFECKCTMLSSIGTCSVYSSRPYACIAFKAGGPECLEIVKERRTSVEYQFIRDKEDPLVL